MAKTEERNGFAPPSPDPPPAASADRPPAVSEGPLVSLDLSLVEAQALRAWLLKPLKDGSSALDNGPVKSAMVKLGAELDFMEAVAAVRDELETAGFATTGLDDEEVAELGRRISQTAAQRLR